MDREEERSFSIENNIEVYTRERDDLQEYVFPALEHLLRHLDRKRCKISILFPEFLRGREGLKVMTTQAFIKALMELEIGINLKQAKCLAKFLDPNHHGEVAMNHLTEFAKVYKRKQDKIGMCNTQSFVSKKDGDEIFPRWLTKRSDFQLMFPRFAHEIKDWEGLMMVALHKLPDQRAQDELEMISNWLKQVPASQIQGIDRSYEMARYIHKDDYAPGQIIYTNGDPSELFYIVFSGQVEILSIAGMELAMDQSGTKRRAGNMVIRTLGPGEAFGYEALGKPRPREGEARVKSSQACKEDEDEGEGARPSVACLLQLSNFHYQLMVLQERNGAINGVIQRLRTHWPMGTTWTHAKLYHLASSGELRRFENLALIFDQDEESTEFYILLHGKCAIKKIVEGSRENRWPDGKASHGHLTKKFEFPVQMRTLVPGDVFGEDTSLLNFSCRQYRVVSLTHNTEVIQVKKEIIQEILSPAEKEEIKNTSRDLYKPKQEILQYYNDIAQHRKSLQHLKESAFGPLYKRRSLFEETKQRKVDRKLSPFDSEFDLLSTHSLGSLDTLSIPSSSHSLPVSRRGSKLGKKYQGRNRDTVSLPTLFKPNYGI